MGYGKNLKNLLDEKGMNVKELARKTGIAPTTLCSIIHRDAAIRFDTALYISNVLDILINSICKDNPYEDMETLLKLPSDKELLIIDQLIAHFYVLDDAARKDVFEYLKIMKKNHSDPKRKKDLRM